MGELAVIYSLITAFNTSLRGGGVTQKVLASLRTTLVMVLCIISSLFSPLAGAHVGFGSCFGWRGTADGYFQVSPGTFVWVQVRTLAESQDSHTVVPEPLLSFCFRLSVSFECPVWGLLVSFLSGNRWRHSVFPQTLTLKNSPTAHAVFLELSRSNNGLLCFRHLTTM